MVLNVPRIVGLSVVLMYIGVHMYSTHLVHAEEAARVEEKRRVWSNIFPSN